MCKDFQGLVVWKTTVPQYDLRSLKNNMRSIFKNSCAFSVAQLGKKSFQQSLWSAIAVSSGCLT